MLKLVQNVYECTKCGHYLYCDPPKALNQTRRFLTCEVCGDMPAVDMRNYPFIKAKKEGSP